MASAPEISAIVCTLDRGPDVALTVDSLLAQDLEPRRYEVLLVDNGSRPENAAVLREQVRRAPEVLRYVVESNVGLSNARNRGIEASLAGIVAFLDDDAIASPGWLRAYRDAFAGDPGVGVLGSKVRLRFASPRPDWMTDDLLGYVGWFDRGEQAVELDYMHCPRGGNMAFRREVFAQAGEFSARFGRKPGSLLSLEEIEICFRVVAAGWRLGYIPDAPVEHIVRPDRFDTEWFRNRLYWQGRSEGLFELLHLGRWHVLRKLPGQVGRWFKRRGLRRCLHAGYVGAVLRNLLRGAASGAT